MLANGSLRLASGAGLASLPGYADGAWWVQDTAAALPARLIGEVRGRQVADLCAAPGGKAMQLAAMGASVTAVEISRQRITRLRENAVRAKLDMTIVEADARAWRPEAPLDAVLLDAPCSALGIIRRHPEGVWRRDPRDLVRFPAMQHSLVDAAHAMLRQGGTMVYAVCTPLPEEGADVIAAAIAGRGWKRLPVNAAEIPGFTHALTPAGDVLSLPHGGESAASAMKSDAFFIARLERL
jgi:16S rRNA (cytosine967-C5)-methyltransferase